MSDRQDKKLVVVDGEINPITLKIEDDTQLGKMFFDAFHKFLNKYLLIFFMHEKICAILIELKSARTCWRINIINRGMTIWPL